MFILNKRDEGKRVEVDAVVGFNGDGEPIKEKLAFIISDEKYTHVLKTVQYLKENERRKNTAGNFDILCKHKPGLVMIYKPII